MYCDIKVNFQFFLIIPWFVKKKVHIILMIVNVYLFFLISNFKYDKTIKFLTNNVLQTILYKNIYIYIIKYNNELLLLAFMLFSSTYSMFVYYII